MPFAQDATLAEEEERKRRAKQGLVAPKPTAPAKPLPLDPWAQRAVSQQQREAAAIPTPKPQGGYGDVLLNTSPTWKFKQAAEQAQQSVVQKKATQGDPLTEYFKLTQSQGTDEVKKRLQAAETIWASYLRPYSRDMVWAMAASPYSIPQMEEMAKQGHKALFGLPPAGKQLLVAPKTMKQYGLDPMDETHKALAAMAASVQGQSTQRVGVIQRLWNIISSPITGSPTDPWVEKNLSVNSPLGEAIGGGLAGPGLVQLGAGRVGTQIAAVTGNPVTRFVAGKALAAPVVAGVMGAATTGIGAVDTWRNNVVQGKIDKELADAQAKMDNPPLKMLPAYDLAQQGRIATGEVAEKPLGTMEKLAQMTDALHHMDVTTNKEIQADLVQSGYLTEAEADGTWGPQQIYAFTKAFQDDQRANVEKQRMYREANLVPSWAPLDGNLDQPVYQRAERDRQEIDAKQAKLKEDNPVLAAFTTVLGLPLNRAAADVFWNKLSGEGVWQSIYKIPLEGAKLMGNAYEATLAAIDLGLRQSRDPIRKQLHTDLWTYIQSQPFQPDAMFKQLPETDDLHFTDAVVTTGYLKDDPKAQELYQKVRQRDAALINERYSGDTISILGNALGLDYAKVEAYSRANPDMVHAANIMRDVTLALAGPNVKLSRIWKGSALERTPEAFKASPVVQKRMAEAVEYVKKDNAGQAQRLIDGGDSSKLVTYLNDVWKGKVNQRTPFWNELAAKVAERVQVGDVEGVKNLTKLDDAAAAALVGKRAPVAAADGTVAPVDPKLISRDLRARQKAKGDVIDLHEVAMDKGAEMWGPGDGNYASIFPYYDSPLMTKTPSLTRSSFKQRTAEIGPDGLRRFISEKWALFEKAPLRDIDYEGLTSPEMVERSALVAYGDVGKAMEARTRWVTGTEKVKNAVADEINQATYENYRLKSKYAGQDARATEPNVNPATGEVIAGPIGRTSMAKYQVSVGATREALRVPYETGTLTGLEKIWKGWMVNPARKFYSSKAMQVGSTVSRRFTVAFSTALGLKHFVSDYLVRQNMEGGLLSTTAFRHNRAKFERLRGEVSPEVAAEAHHREVINHLNEQNYNMGGGSGTHDSFDVGHIFDEADKPANMKEGVDALRRIATDKVFREYVKGGDEAVRAWLNSKEGRQFLATKGHYEVTRALAGEETVKAQDLYADTVIKPMPDAKAVHEATVQQFMDTYVDQYRDFEKAMPQTFEGLGMIARNEIPVSAKNIEALVWEVNKNGVVENPALSSPTHEAVSFSTRMTETLPGDIMSLQMHFNKKARDAMFYSTWNKVYERARKTGADADQAGSLANDIAYLNTARVHFDLANAMNVEARHRWFAWFATKHRLYASYLLRMSVERPWVANAALEVNRWMEDRNSDPNIPEWDRNKLIFNIAGMPVKLNLAPVLWLSDYPLESGTGKAVEWLGGQATKLGGSTWENVTGGHSAAADLHPNFGEFGLSFSRFDSIVRTIGVWTPVLFKMAERGTTDLSDEDVQALDGTMGSGIFGSSEVQRRFRKSISLRRAYHEMKGEEVTAGQALSEAMLSDLGNQAWLAFRPLSGRIIWGEEDKFAKLQQDYFKADPKTRSQMLIDNPSLGTSFYGGDYEPTKKMELDAGWEAYRKIREEHNAKVEQAMKDGTLYDHTVMNAIFSEYDTKMAMLTEKNRLPVEGETDYGIGYNAAFSEMWNDQGVTPELQDMMKAVYPLVDPKAAAYDGYKPHVDQVEAKRDELVSQFDQYLLDNNINPGATSDPVYTILRRKLVNEPLAKFSKTDPYGYTTNEEETIADTLARGPNGQYLQEKFLKGVEDRYKLTLVMQGLDAESASGINKGRLVMSVLTPKQKADLGFNTDDATEKMWLDYAYDMYRLKVAANEYKDPKTGQGISTSSTRYAKAKEQLADYYLNKGASNKNFMAQWDFSLKPLVSRLEMLGMGKGTDEVSHGWNEMFGIYKDYRAALANVQKSRNVRGVGPQAQAAAPAARYYLEQVLELSQRNKKWFESFRHDFTASDFDFFWGLPGATDAKLDWFAGSDKLAAVGE